MREQRDLTSPQMPHGKTHCVSMQPPPQSGVLLFAKHNHLAPHSFTGYQPLISGCRVYGTTSHSHDNSPSSAAAVCRGHFSNSHDNSPSSAAAVCRGHFSNSHDNSPSSAAAVCRGHFSNSHDNSPSSAAAVCRGHFLIHMITSPHQRLPCVEDISNSHDNIPSSAAAVCRGLRSLTHSRR